MLRLTDLKLSLGHSEEALTAAILKRLGIARTALTGFTVVRRGQDARKKPNVLFVYTIDAEVEDEAGVLARLKDKHVGPTPDTAYKFVATAPAHFSRPVVIGAGRAG